MHFRAGLIYWRSTCRYDRRDYTNEIGIGTRRHRWTKLLRLCTGTLRAMYGLGIYINHHPQQRSQMLLMLRLDLSFYGDV